MDGYEHNIDESEGNLNQSNDEIEDSKVKLNNVENTNNKS